MSKGKPQADLDMDPFSAWSDRQLSGWHKAVEELALQGWHALGGDDMWVVVSQGLEDARHAGKIDEALEKAFHNLFWDTVRVIGVYAYALGRTQPSGLDEFEDWPRRALELAGLPALSGTEEGQQS